MKTRVSGLLMALFLCAALLTQSAPGTAARSGGKLPAAHPIGIVAGPDGALWFTENDGIGRITLDGHISQFHVPGMVQVSEATAEMVCSCDSGIASGPDGNLYFAERHAIGRLVIGKQPTSISIAPHEGPPRSLILGPDGNIWFTVPRPTELRTEADLGDFVAKMSLDGHITWYHPRPPLRLNGLAAGSDGTIWMAVDSPPAIVRMTTQGQTVETSLIHGSSTTCDTHCNAYSVTKGPAGDIWFSAGYRLIGRTPLAGRITLFALPRRKADLLNQPDAMIAGHDGRIWFTEDVAKYIGAITPVGQVHEYTVPGARAEVFPGIAVGRDQNIWFTEMCGSNIGRITPAGRVTTFHLPDTRTQREEAWCPYFMP